MRRRLLLSYLALTIVILLLLEVPLGLLEARQEHDALAATARRDATALAVLAVEELSSPGLHDLAALASRYRAQADSEVAIMDATGRIVVTFDPDEPNDGSSELAPVMRASLNGGLGRTVTRKDERTSQLVAILPVRSADSVVGVVAVAVPATSTDRRVAHAWAALALLAGILIAVGCGLGVVLARSLTSPLTHLQATAERLGGGDLSARASPGGPRELVALAEEFNQMADELAGMVDGQRRFVADASHQLRTPLTALRLRLENLSEPSAEDDLPAAVAGCQSEVERLARLVDGLLALSRAEGKPVPAQWADVAAVVLERSRAWDALAEERDVTVRVAPTGDEPVIAAIDPDHLEQVLDNLLANAVEASPPHTAIELAVERAPAGIVVRVRDHGPGLAGKDLERAFDRFWQGANGAEGSSGLGLPIVRELLRTSGGTITLASPGGGGLEAIVSLRPASR